jgi:hypothetical protein
LRLGHFSQSFAAFTGSFKCHSFDQQNFGYSFQYSRVAVKYFAASSHSFEGFASLLAAVASTGGSVMDWLQHSIVTSFTNSITE